MGIMFEMKEFLSSLHYLSELSDTSPHPIIGFKTIYVIFKYWNYVKSRILIKAGYYYYLVLHSTGIPKEIFKSVKIWQVCGMEIKLKLFLFIIVEHINITYIFRKPLHHYPNSCIISQTHIALFCKTLYYCLIISTFAQ